MDYRYERKYRIEAATLLEIKQAILQSPVSFQTSFPDRQVNSLYLDNPQFAALQDNLNGIAERSKFRIRWYGDNWTVAQQPILEKKIKINKLGTKERQSLPDFVLDADFSLTDYLATNLPDLNSLHPVVLIAYHRSYYETFDHRVRLTIDSNIRHTLVNNNLIFGNHFLKDPDIILEIKYGENEERHLENIFQHLPFRLTKNSKFVNGVIANYY